jgi:hypothetical protein
LPGAELVATKVWPASIAQEVCADTPLQITFNEHPLPGRAGRLAVYDAADNRLVDEIQVREIAPDHTNSYAGKTIRYQPIDIHGVVVSVELHSHALASAKNYYVEIDPGTFRSESGNAFGGFTNRNAWVFKTRETLPRGRTNLIVAADGSADFCTPQAAVDYFPDDNHLPAEIFIKKGEYRGCIYVPPDKGHVRIRGESREATILSGENNERLNSGRAGRALVSVDADDFTLENLTVRNTTPPGGSQAEALRVRSERCVLRDATFCSFQDTLLLSGRVYVTNCFVAGDVDFVWGQGSAFFDHCELRALRNGYYVQARNPADQPGYVFLDCLLTAAPEVQKCLLARIEADRFPDSAVAFINCQMEKHIPSVGWEVKGSGGGRLRFGEFNTTDEYGRPVNVTGRHPASHQLSRSEAEALSDPGRVLSYHDRWNPQFSEGVSAPQPSRAN